MEIRQQPDRKRKPNKGISLPDLEDLVAFKQLKDQHNPVALAIYSAYEQSGNTAAFNAAVVTFLRERENKPMPSNAVAPTPPTPTTPFMSESAVVSTPQAPLADAYRVARSGGSASADPSRKTFTATERICYCYRDKGYCPNGDACIYPHVEVEGRPPRNTPASRGPKNGHGNGKGPRPADADSSVKQQPTKQPKQPRKSKGVEVTAPSAADGCVVADEVAPAPAPAAEVDPASTPAAAIAVAPVVSSVSHIPANTPSVSVPVVSNSRKSDNTATSLLRSFIGLGVGSREEASPVLAESSVPAPSPASVVPPPKKKSPKHAKAAAATTVSESVEEAHILTAPTAVPVPAPAADAPFEEAKLDEVSASPITKPKKKNAVKKVIVALDVAPAAGDQPPSTSSTPTAKLKRGKKPKSASDGAGLSAEKSAPVLFDFDASVDTSAPINANPSAPLAAPEAGVEDGSGPTTSLANSCTAEDELSGPPPGISTIPVDIPPGLSEPLSDVLVAAGESQLPPPGYSSPSSLHTLHQQFLLHQQQMQQHMPQDSGVLQYGLDLSTLGHIQGPPSGEHAEVDDPSKRALSASLPPHPSQFYPGFPFPGGYGPGAPPGYFMMPPPPPQHMMHPGYMPMPMPMPMYPGPWSYGQTPQHWHQFYPPPQSMDLNHDAIMNSMPGQVQPLHNEQISDENSSVYPIDHVSQLRERFHSSSSVGSNSMVEHLSPPLPTSSTTSPAPDSLLHSHSNDGFNEVVAGGGGSTNTAAPTSAPAHAYKPGRITRNQPGTLRLSVLMRSNSNPNLRTSNGSVSEVYCDSDGVSVRPGSQMTVDWQLPASVFRDAENLVIALVRYGAVANHMVIISKPLGPLNRNNTESTDMFGNSIIQGRKPFHAPKGSGKYVFRIFDSCSNKSKLAVTLATSFGFVVELMDMEVTMNLKFSYESFVADQPHRAVSQLLGTVVGIRNSGRRVHSDDPAILMQKNVQYLLKAANMSVVKVAESRARSVEEKAMREAHQLAGTTPPAPTKAEEDYWFSIRQLIRLQSDIVDCVYELINNKVAWGLISNDGLRDQLSQTLRLYCPLLARLFGDFRQMQETRQVEFGFVPAGAYDRSVLTQESLNELRNLDRSIVEKLPSFIPAEDYSARRDQIRLRIERILLNAAIVPVDTRLVLYGSSSNNFGVETADLDMCLLFPHGYTLSTENKPLFLESLGNTLAAAGMQQVLVRSTARIPIVNFRDPVTDLECDISFYNPLAVTNTKMLLSYSRCDPRVRPLAYIIKRWVKARHINNPSDGTLGSYAYLLCLIHFLQKRSPPVLPYLQRLPRDWHGEYVSGQAASPNSLEIELHPVDNTPCRTYFYNVTQTNVVHCRNFGALNKESIAELLTGFFSYFAWEFDYKHSVVSVQGDNVLKSTKAEVDAWGQHDRLSIEDPFETWYDVAHVLRGPQMNYIRKEFIRAHTLIGRAMRPVSAEDTLPAHVSGSQLLDVICEIGEIPSFVSHLKDSKERDRTDSVAQDLEI